MRYISTRGTAPTLGFAQATLAGLATDGGLYVPELWPHLPEPEIAGMACEPYAEIASRVMRHFVGNDLTLPQLHDVVQAAYGVFDTPDVVPLKRLGDRFYVMEMFHGPTLAFKDVALQFLGQVFDVFLKRAGKKVTIVGATSGDTGSAAIEAFRGKDSADIFILHPKGRVSEVQRRQMTTALESNVHNIAVQGSFDDCQNLVKAMFNDAQFRADMNLSAVNSINWARIMAQVVYYVAASAKLRAETGKPVTFVVPTGNFGNIYAGYAAKQMGAPVDRLVAATNANDILHRFFTTGQMKQERAVSTTSPSMDIQVSSNFERLLFEAFGHHGDAVAETMRHFSAGGTYHLEAQPMAALRETFSSGRRDDAGTAAVMQHFWREKKYLADPHTAVGLGVAGDYAKAHPSSVIVTLATAHPAKFPDAVKQATGQAAPLPERMRDLFTRTERYDVLPCNLKDVQDFVRAKARKT